MLDLDFFFLIFAFLSIFSLSFSPCFFPQSISAPSIHNIFKKKPKTEGEKKEKEPKPEKDKEAKESKPSIGIFGKKKEKDKDKDKEKDKEKEKKEKDKKEKEKKDKKDKKKGVPPSPGAPPGKRNETKQLRTKSQPITPITKPSKNEYVTSWRRFSTSTTQSDLFAFCFFNKCS